MQPLDQLPNDTPSVLLRSRDGGESWERLPIAGTTLNDRAFIAAVDPTNPDMIYVRVQGESKWDGEVIESFLLRSEDAGDTWQEIFRGNADMLGFSLSADGSEVSIGLGDSHDPTGTRAVDADALGVYRAGAPDFAFTRVSVGQVSCLTRSVTGLFVCSSQASSGYELGLSKDGGANSAAVLELGQIREPLACGKTERVCSGEWSKSCSLFGTCSTVSTGQASGRSVTASTGPTSTGKGCNVVSLSPNVAAPHWSAGVLLSALIVRRWRAANRVRRTRPMNKPAS